MNNIITTKKKYEYIKTLKLPLYRILDFFKIEKFNKKHKYYNVSSLKQFSQLYKLSKNDMNLFSSLIQLVSRFVKIDILKLIELFNKYSHNDKLMYDKLRYHYNKNKKNNKPKTNTQGDKKIKKKYKNISQNKIADIIYYYMNRSVKNLKIKKYLDFGCGDCKKTYYIGKKFGLNKENIIGADIEEWFDYSDETRDVDNITFLDISKKIDIEDNSISLITCIMSLHHIKELDKTIKELYRICEKGGYLVLIEHDSFTHFDHMLIDVEHGMFEMVQKNNEKYFNTYYSKYFNWIEWDLIMNYYGFKYIYAVNISSSVRFNVSMDRKFIAIYQKN